MAKDKDQLIELIEGITDKKELRIIKLMIIGYLNAKKSRD